MEEQLHAFVATVVCLSVCETVGTISKVLARSALYLRGETPPKSRRSGQDQGAQGRSSRPEVCIRNGISRGSGAREWLGAISEAVARGGKSRVK